MSEYISYIEEIFRDFGPVKARKMFGGYGLYHDGIMFGLIVDEQLYLKADESIEEYFKDLSLPQFEYPKGEKMIKMSYFLAPDEVLEDPEQAAIWGLRSLRVAKRHFKPKKKRLKRDLYLSCLIRCAMTRLLIRRLLNLTVPLV